MSNSLVVQGETFITMKEQADLLVKSGFLPKTIKTPEQALAIAIKGVEIGLPMMQSFAQINIIEGKPTISAEGMNFLIRKNCPRAKLDVLERSNERCRIRAERPGSTPVEFEFSIEDAKKAQLMASTAWQRYPKSMMFARCMSDLARTLFPDCIGGVSYTPEELGQNVNENGEVIEVEVKK